MTQDTIAAVATPRGTGGIAVIRLSGETAIEVAQKIFIGNQSLLEAESHKMLYGKFTDGKALLDYGLVCVFRSPHSYTGEDSVEFYCHGGNRISSRILEACLQYGARLAQPGEFTRRALLNGKLDLVQAEAVGDLIHAGTDMAATAAVNQLDGRLSKEINQVRNRILDLSAHLLAVLDYSEEGVEELTISELIHTLEDCQNSLTVLLSTADQGRYIRDGINVAIVGAPNVGKSSLLNAFSGEETAIVTEIAGTTRDSIEVSVQMKGVRLNLIDTAGIRSTSDRVEGIGVERAKKWAEKADLILMVLDGTRTLSAEDEKILELVQQKRVFYLVNKIDQTVKLTTNIQPLFYISAQSGEGLENLFEQIAAYFIKEGVEKEVILTNERHKDAAIRAGKAINLVLTTLKAGMPSDLVLSDIEDAASALGEITGQTVSDEIIDKIFENFCVGK